MSTNRNQKGRVGEDRAAEHLLERGYTIVSRNVTTRWGEIDLVALDQEVLVFIEVRFRSDDLGEESVGAHKAAAMRRAAAQYVQEHSIDREIRFDLIAISDESLRHHEAFL